MRLKIKRSLLILILELKIVLIFKNFTFLSSAIALSLLINNKSKNLKKNKLHKSKQLRWTPLEAHQINHSKESYQRYLQQHLTS